MPRCRRVFVIAFVTTCLCVVVLYAGAASGMFGHCCPRLNANETAAIATVRNIHSAQQQFHDAVGRFGTFAELSAAAPLPETGHPLDPPVLSKAFSQPLPDGTILRSGYRFRIDLADGTWCVWSWPEKRMAKQTRTFCVYGDARVVHSTEDARHEDDRGPVDGDDPVWAVVR